MARKPPALRLSLSDLQPEKFIPAGSALWGAIQGWQRSGLVSLRWGDDAEGAWVSLTDRGRERVASGSHA